jgi:hypothetical protein
MEQVRFFYSTNGADVHGPVTEDALRLLIQTQTLGPGSYICREGESEWKPCNFEGTPRPVAVTEPYRPPPYVPTPEALERMKLPEEEGPIPETLNRIFWALAIGVSIALTMMVSPHADSGAAIPHQLGALTAHLIFFALLPILIAWPFKRHLRNMVRVVVVVVLSGLVFLGERNSSAMRIEAAADAMNQETATEARRQIAAKGYYQGDPEKADDYMQKLKAAATGDSQSARLTRDLIATQDALMVKVRASQAAEKECDVDPTTITSLDDFAHRQAAIKKLHDAQTDVIAFLQDYNDRCREAMAHDNFDAPVVIEAIEGARKGAHIDLLIDLWRINQKLTDDHAARLAFLEKNWGHWNVKGGKMLFQDDASLTTYNGYIETLREDVKRMGEAQKQIFQ